MYTFGPLHFHHLVGEGGSGSVAMLAGIFGIGLCFGVLFRTSGNLWMVGIFHGLGNWYTAGLGAVVG